VEIPRFPFPFEEGAGREANEEMAPARSDDPLIQKKGKNLAKDVVNFGDDEEENEDDAEFASSPLFLAVFPGDDDS